MPFVGNIHVGPAGQPEVAGRVKRAEERRRAAKAESKAEASRREDEAELASATEVDESQAIRSAKGNSDEESRDDRTSQGYYSRGTGAPPVKRHRLDVAG
jgi:hypothetical protein